MPTSVQITVVICATILLIYIISKLFEHRK